MRMTSQGRPYTKDLYDMFAAVLLQINLTDHRIMFRYYPYTFTTDEAAKVMSNLTFIHVHRDPDPEDPSRQIATRTTTTFSMDSTTARYMLQQFLASRLIMSATDPTNWSMKDKGLWSPTVKGKYVLEEFTDTTQVSMSSNLIAALNAPYMTPGSNGRLITLERLSDNDDQITFSRPNMTMAFKAMMSSLPRDALFMEEIVGIEKRSLSNAYEHTIAGSHCVEWLCDRLTVNSREEAEMVAAQFVMFGWLSLVLDRSDRVLSGKDDVMSFKTNRNAIYYVTERGCLLIGWKPVSMQEDESIISDLSLNEPITPSDTILPRKREISSQSDKLNTASEYHRTAEQANSTAPLQMIRHDSAMQPAETPQPEDQKSRPSSASIAETAPLSDFALIHHSQWTKLMHILETPLIRMYFRDFLSSNYCAENISFWVDHNKLYKTGKSTLEKLADAYTIYELYFSPYAPADLNINHSQNQEIIRYVSTHFAVVQQIPTSTTPHFVVSSSSGQFASPTKSSLKANPRLLLMPPQVASEMSKKRTVVIRGITPEACLVKMLAMYSKVNDHVCRMMAEDSVPKFVKTQKYQDLISRQQKQQQQEESDSDDESIYFEDSDDEDKTMITLATALSAQRSSMEHTRQRDPMATAAI
ncbi:Developmental regulator flbA [Choanephora cucurbitarum]|uniref:Developmental regulator flbA n=1 Tax=Choanephora cucurbitarum TaxID=101091 RepID=A0A1C7NEQ9_9FUNG|nr:Developmental regulator flbA [Choanephora cucurbitarum]